MGAGGEDVIVVKAVGAPTATEAKYVDTGFIWGPNKKVTFSAFPNETTSAVPGSVAGFPPHLGQWNATAPACSAILVGRRDAWCRESVCGKCDGWPHCARPQPPPPPGNWEAGWGCGQQWEGYATRTHALYQPIMDWCALPAQRKAGIRCSSHSSISWRVSEYGHGRVWDGLPSMPWMEQHPDREISTELLGSLTKYFPMHGGMDSEAGQRSIAQGVVAINGLLNSMSADGLGFTNCVMGAKAQSGMPPEVVRRFHSTAQNPVLLNTVGLWLMYFNIPSLPQLPPSATLLKTLWPRLQNYAFRDRDKDPLWSSCSKGATGDEVAAVECFTGWRARVPELTALVGKIRDQLWETFPNEKDGAPYSGSYWNEADFADRAFQASHWGTKYPRLLALKKKYDPMGLFVCHHCVGSELWSADGNCRL